LCAEADLKKRSISDKQVCCKNRGKKEEPPWMHNNETVRHAGGVKTTNPLELKAANPRSGGVAWAGNHYGDQGTPCTATECENNRAPE